MTVPVALVTGASSGIGHALVQHLMKLKWNVVMADVTPPSETVPGTLFVQTDVSSWDQQVYLFQKAYEWQGRLDFCALNAGIDDRDDIFTFLDEPPRRPNLGTFEVNLIGVYYGIRIAAHYLSKANAEAGKLYKGGKIVLTGSGAAIWPIPILPQYTATKHAITGLGRSIGRSDGAKLANIRVTVLCPAIVATTILPQGVLDAMSPEQLTPMNTIMRGYDYLADLDHAHQDDWVGNGPSGLVLEANGTKLIEHHPPARTTEGSMPTPEAAGSILQSFKARVEGHARRWAEKQAEEERVKSEQ